MVEITLLWDGNREVIARARNWAWAHQVAEGLIWVNHWQERRRENHIDFYVYRVYDALAETEVEILLVPAE